MVKLLLTALIHLHTVIYVVFVNVITGKHENFVQQKFKKKMCLEKNVNNTQVISLAHVYFFFTSFTFVQLTGGWLSESLLQHLQLFLHYLRHQKELIFLEKFGDCMEGQQKCSSLFYSLNLLLEVVVTDRMSENWSDGCSNSFC